MMKPPIKGGKKRTVKRRGASRPRPVEQATLPRWSQRALVVAAFLVIVIAMTREPKRVAFSPEDVQRSIVAREDVRAAFSFDTVDLAKTSEAEDQAASKVPEHYRVDYERVQQQLAALNERINQIREQRTALRDAVLAALRASTSAESKEEIVAGTVNEFVSQLATDPAWSELAEQAVLELWLTPDLASIPERVFATNEEGEEESPAPVVALEPAEPGPFQFSTGDRLAELARQSLNYVLSAGVRGASLPANAAATIVRVQSVEDLPLSSSVSALSELPDTPQATELLGERLRETARRAAKDAGDAEWAKLHEAAWELAQPLITDTIERDAVSTADARQRAREDVDAVQKTIEAGETIQAGGFRWTTQSKSDALRYLEILSNDEQPLQRLLASLVAHMILVGLVLWCIYKGVSMLGRKHETTFLQQFNLALLLIACTLVISRVAWYFQPTGFILPLAAAGILYAILVNGRMAALVSMLIAVLVSAQYGYDWRVLIVQGAMSLAGVFSIYQVRRRSDMAGASITAAIVGVVAMLAITLAVDSLTTNAIIQRLGLILLNGCLCLLVVPALLSPLERLFGITTDIQLLEYSDLNNELLSKLAIEVPATYAHSLMLGQLAEAAADAIGANGLKARVCAYYHDIGKMRRPEYFIENQTGANIHDELSPRLSARAIAAHVIQGAEMAREYHLPKPIRDGILEHHGTCLIGYFYGQAQKTHKHGDAREEDFRYPGPKPQSPETAILMICDASESGVRSIKNPNEERVREFVDKIIAARLADRQFDECDLTMRQLDTIAEVVSQRIVSNLHGRITYPEPLRDAPADRDNIIPMTTSQPGTMV